jgi:high-affinity iron transporter
VTIVAAVALALLAAPAGAAPPWQSADRIRTDLFDAQTALLLGERANRGAADTARLLRGPIEQGMRRFAPGELRRLRGDLAAAGAAYARRDQVGLAAARGRILADLRRAAFRITLAAVRNGRVALARQWFLIRDFRSTTRFSRPGASGTAALEELAARETSRHEAAAQVRKDLLDAYQFRLGTNLDEAEQAAERGFDARFAETAAIAAGYWPLIAPEYRDQRGAAAARRVSAGFEALEGSAAATQVARFAALRKQLLGDLDGFVAAPLTPEEQARRANQLTRFLELIPFEYDHGTEGEQVTIPFEIQEAVAFQEGAQQAYDDLKGELQEIDPASTERVERTLVLLERYTADANEGRRVVPLEDVEAAEQRAADTLDAVFPDEWKESSDEADYDLVDISLDQMEAAVSAGAWDQAEQARLSAYGFFEFGPEPKLRAFDPSLVLKVEGLVWYGASGDAGLAQLIADRASVADVRETRAALDEALAEARAKTGEGASDTTVITNAATIVFREGLEAILIIAAITASLIGARRRLRTPIYRGALAAIPASIAVFFAAQLVIDSLSRYGEKLEAAVGLLAIGVLLLVMNWFFHRVYWTEWIAGHRERSKELTEGAVAGAVVGGGTIAGLYVLGFSSVFREGVETVLFLQALQLSSGTGVVLAGVGLASIATAAVGVATFKLEQRLPYKRMLVVTGVLIALVLVVLVGNTMRTMQGVGWIPITPIHVEFPLWAGTWFGLFPTVETLGAQAAAFGLVIGSYFLAEWVRKRNVRRVIERADAGADRPGPNGSRRDPRLPTRVEAPESSSRQRRDELARR